MLSRRAREPGEFASFVLPRPRAVMAERLNERAPVTNGKDSPLRSEPYRRLVAAMACIHCGQPGPSQAAHADQGKGAGLKTDDRTCYPVCAARPGLPGCHDAIGGSGAFGKARRRALETRYAALTRERIRKAGQWPARLPQWVD